MIKIDKEKIYESHGYKFHNFVSLTYEEKLMILNWRNSNKVRQMMVNNNEISKIDHLHFIEGLKERDDCYYWLVKDTTAHNIGVLDIIHVNRDLDEGEIGYYLNPSEVGKGFEFMIECNYFVYSQLQLGNNKATINVNNKEILLFNKYLGIDLNVQEKIGDDYFYVNNHVKGDYIINHYDEFNVLDYARFVKRNKDILLNQIK